MKKYPSYML